MEWIDREIVPVDLADRQCVSDPGWADDGLALVLGAQAYLNLVEAQLTIPPARVEPVDSLRESFMARRLRELHLAPRKTLVVCDLARVSPIRRLLRRPAGVAELADIPRRLPDLRRVRPSLSTTLEYLDDLPAVTARFESVRTSRPAAALDKSVLLMEFVHGLREEADDLMLSVRSLKAFAQRSRISP